MKVQSTKCGDDWRRIFCGKEPEQSGQWSGIFEKLLLAVEEGKSVSIKGALI